MNPHLWVIEQKIAGKWVVNFATISGTRENVRYWIRRFNSYQLTRRPRSMRRIRKYMAVSQ